MMIFFFIQFNLHLQRPVLKDPYWLTLFNRWGLFSHRSLLISWASTSVQLLTSWGFFWWPRNWGLQPSIRQSSGSDLPQDRLLSQNLAHSMLNVTFVPFPSLMTTVCLLETVLQQSPEQSRQTARALREVKCEPAPTEGALWGLMETASEPPVSTHPPPADWTETSSTISLIVPLIPKSLWSGSAERFILS